MDLQSLHENFGLPGILTFDEPQPGAVRAQATTPACTAELYLQGAHLTQWQPAGHEPVLFLSPQSDFAPGKAIRGGVPLIFPWFGAPESSPVHPSSHAGNAAPSHGFARTAPWTLVFAALAGDELHLSLSLGPDEHTRELGFDHFQLAYELRLGRELRLRLSVANTGDEPLLLEEAFHSYLAVGDATQVTLTGLENTEFLDKTEAFARKRQPAGELTLQGETDRAYLNTAAPVTLLDPVLKRRVTVSKQGSQTTVVWNPWSALAAKLPDLDDNGWQRFTCIETANAAENVIHLHPREAHTMEAHLTVESTK